MRPHIAARSQVIGTEGVGGKLAARHLVVVSSTRDLVFGAPDFFIFAIELRTPTKNQFLSIGQFAKPRATATKTRWLQEDQKTGSPSL
jgi:hypothetical protein